MLKIKEWAIISRFKMEVATIVNPLIGIFLASNSLEDLYNISILIYIIIYLLIIVSSSELNCYFDMGIDKHYKKKLYFATKLIGGKKIKIASTSMIFLSSILIVYLAYHNFLITSILAAFGMMISIIYSVPPFRLKGAGISGFIALVIGIFALPVLGGWFLIKETVTINFLIFLIGYVFMNSAFILINIGEDYEEDLREDIRTISHVIGIDNTAKLSFLMLTIGLPLIFYFLLRYSSNFFFFIFIIAFLIFYIIALKDIYYIMDREIKNVMKNIKRYAYKVPLWFSMTRYPLLFAIFMHLLVV